MSGKPDSRQFGEPVQELVLNVRVDDLGLAGGDTNDQATVRRPVCSHSARFPRHLKAAVSLALPMEVSQRQQSATVGARDAACLPCQTGYRVGTAAPA